MLEAYKRAATIYGANAKKHVLNETVSEKWIEGTEDFWFAKDIVSPEGEIKTEYSRYCRESNEVRPLFDHAKLAEAICQWDEKATALDLPITILEVNGLTGLIYFSIKETVGEFTYCLKTGQVDILRFPLHAKDEITSPDKKHTAFIRNCNVFCRCNKSGKETQLTFDGEPALEYARRFSGASEKVLKKVPMVGTPALRWSPDSKHILTYRRDTRKVGLLNLVQSVPIDGSARPIHVSYPYSLPGDDDILTAQVYLINVEAKTSRKVTLDGAPFELLLLYMFDADGDQVKWTADGKTACMVTSDRYFKHTKAVLIDAETATARTAAEQIYKTFSFTEYFGNASQESFFDSGLHYLPETNELIWLLEKDEGHASLYLIDAATGEVKRDLTPGDYTARRVRYIDKEKRVLWFSASGREDGIDPYYQQLYTVSLDTGEINRLTVETAEHFTRFRPKGGYFIDTYSTVQTVPETRVCAPDGSVLCHIATADISRIIEKGFVFPEPFEAVARDGKTPIYGVIIKPFGFDPNKKYPVVDYIYGGSQRINTPKAFEFGRMLESDPQGGLQSLAQLGFVGVIVDGLATPLREKRIHDVAYGKAEECCGIEDHVCAIKQLAERYSWIDAESVGICGASGGGYATARALLQFPEFYKVGVSLCGDHDQAKYHSHWGDRWIGPYSEQAYHNQANRNFAANLEGHLLLVHGDMDDNVHPSATLHLAADLIKANKDFDMLIYPNSNHGVGQFPYVVRRRWDYFVRHLMGATPPKNFVVKEEEKPEEKAEEKK